MIHEDTKPKRRTVNASAYIAQARRIATDSMGRLAIDADVQTVHVKLGVECTGKHGHEPGALVSCWLWIRETEAATTRAVTTPPASAEKETR